MIYKGSISLYQKLCLHITHRQYLKDLTFSFFYERLTFFIENVIFALAKYLTAANQEQHLQDTHYTQNRASTVEGIEPKIAESLRRIMFLLVSQFDQSYNLVSFNYQYVQCIYGDGVDTKRPKTKCPITKSPITKHPKIHITKKQNAQCYKTSKNKTPK